MARTHFDALVSRPWQVVAGVLLLPLALGALALAYLGADLALSGSPPPPGSGIVFPAFGLVGISSLVLSLRLVLNRPRQADRGLLSPMGLRLAGLLWLVAGVALGYQSPAWILELGFILAASTSCFALARKRQVGLEERSL